MTPQLVAVMVWVLALVETPHGVPARPGPAGETGRWQLTPAVRVDRGAELRALGIRVTDEALARAQVQWLAHQLQAAGVDSSPFNVALAWNAGLTQTLRGRAPERAYEFAGRVRHLVELKTNEEKDKPMKGKKTPAPTVPVNDRRAGTIEGSDRPVRLKHWSELNTDEKIERMRTIIKRMDRTASELGSRVHDIGWVAQNHQHAKGGEVLISAKVKRYDQGGCEVEERRPCGGGPDDVFF